MTREASPSAPSVEVDEPPLYMELLVSGVRVPDRLPIGSKIPHRVRSGSCGGLDLVLPDGRYVNAPVNEHFVTQSAFRLRLDEEDRATVINDETGESIPVSIPKAPEYYDHAVCSSGRKMAQVGQICSDRLGIGITNRCTFWSHKSERCRFCSIGLNVESGAEVRNKDVLEIVELVDVAVEDPVLPARHILLGGGTPPGSDAGARAMAQATEKIKERHPDIPVYAMMVPPADERWIVRLREAGVDELGMNVEFFSDEAASTYMPGKHQRLGLATYLSALTLAVDTFGPVNTRSIVIVGLEPAEHTVRGAARLASMGVMPILTPFRPLVGTPMEYHERWSSRELWRLTVEAADAVSQHDIPLGPTCVPCQSNTLIAGDHPLYRHY